MGLFDLFVGLLFVNWLLVGIQLVSCSADGRFDAMAVADW